MTGAWGNSGSWGNSGDSSTGSTGNWGTPGGGQQDMVYDGTALGFDDAISYSGAGYIVLKPGEYDFTVKSFERGYFNGNEKQPGCPTVKMNFQVETPEGTATVTHTFFLRKWETSIDQIYNFFVSIGMVTVKQREDKVPIVPKWNESVGCKGRFEIRNTSKKDDQTVVYNNVKRFVDPR